MSKTNGVADLLFGSFNLEPKPIKQKSYPFEEDHHLPKPPPKTIPSTIKANTKPVQTKKQPEPNKPAHQSKQIPNPSPKLAKKVIVKTNPKEQKLLNKIKNFDNINELFDVIERNNKDFTQLFPEQKKDLNNISKDNVADEKGKYKPTSKHEEKLYKKIDEINKVKVKEELSLMSKKHKREKDNKDVKRRMKVSLNDDDIFCARCRCMHDPNKHKHKIPAVPDMKKIFTILPQMPKGNTANDMKNKIEALKQKVRSKEASIPAPKRKEDLNGKIQQIKKEIAKQNHKSLPAPKGYFRKEDFMDDEDDFIVSDEDDDVRVKQEMKRFKGKFGGRRNHYSDDDLEVADFDLIQQEEDRTARIGDYEDYEEELREKGIKPKKHK